MRLSLKKAAYVAVVESSVAGNPEFARDDKVEVGDFCEVPSDWMDRKKQQAPALRFGPTARRDRRRLLRTGGVCH